MDQSNPPPVTLKMSTTKLYSSDVKLSVITMGQTSPPPVTLKI